MKSRANYNLAVSCVLLFVFILAQKHHYEYVKATSRPVEQRTAQIYRITAYCPGKCCCGEWSDGFTASGAKAEGKLIAAPKDIPFGTWINVPGYGYAEVLDRGGVIKGRRLDVLFPTHQEALNWGVKNLRIEL